MLTCWLPGALAEPGDALLRGRASVRAVLRKPMLIVLYWGFCCGLEFQSFGSEHVIEKEESKTGGIL
jgi:hypothetical protein